MALATTCPQCKTSFKVVPDQLKLRRGLVRCGVCQHVFSGIDYLRYVDDAARTAQRLARERAAQGGATGPRPGAAGPVPATIATAPGGSSPAGTPTDPGSLVTSVGGAVGRFDPAPRTEPRADPSPRDPASPFASPFVPPAPVAGSAPLQAAPAAAPAPAPASEAPSLPPGLDPWAAAAREAHERSLRDTTSEDPFASSVSPPIADPARPFAPVASSMPAARPAPMPDAPRPDAAPAPAADREAFAAPWSETPAIPRSETPAASGLDASTTPGVPVPATAGHEPSAAPRFDAPSAPARFDAPSAPTRVDAPSAQPRFDAPSAPLRDAPPPAHPTPADRFAEAPPEPVADASAGPPTRGGLPALPAPETASRPPTPDLDGLLARPSPSWPPTATGPQTIISGDEDLKTAFFLPDTAIGPPGAAGPATRLQTASEPDPVTLLRPEGRSSADDAPRFDPPDASPPSVLETAPPPAWSPRDGESAIDYFSGSGARSRGFGLALSPAAWVAAATLSLLLVLQAVIGWRDGLAARVPLLEPVLSLLLSPFDAAPRPPRDLDALTIEGFELQSAGGPDTLQLAAVLRNRSGHVVGYPAMELSLTDSAGALLVRKVIPAEDYLPDAAQRSAGLPGGTERPLRLALEHGGLQPTGYTVALFYP